MRVGVSFPLLVAAITMRLSMGLSTDTSDEEEAFLGLAALNQPAFSDYGTGEVMARVPPKPLT